MNNSEVKCPRCGRICVTDLTDSDYVGKCHTCRAPLLRVAGEAPLPEHQTMSREMLESRYELLQEELECIDMLLDAHGIEEEHGELTRSRIGRIKELSRRGMRVETVG